MFYLLLYAPDKLMNVVRCNCKQSSKNQCGLNLCSGRKNGLSCVVDAVESVVIMELWTQQNILKTIINCQKNYFDHKCVYVPFADYRGGSRSFTTSKMELFMIIDKSYILDMASFQGLSLYHVTMLFIGLVLCKKNIYYYWFNIRQVLQCKIFF